MLIDIRLLIYLINKFIVFSSSKVFISNTIISKLNNLKVKTI